MVEEGAARVPGASVRLVIASTEHLLRDPWLVPAPPAHRAATIGPVKVGVLPLALFRVNLLKIRKPGQVFMNIKTLPTLACPAACLVPCYAQSSQSRGQRPWSLGPSHPQDRPASVQNQQLSDLWRRHIPIQGDNGKVILHPLLPPSQLLILRVQRHILNIRRGRLTVLRAV